MVLEFFENHLLSGYHFNFNKFKFHRIQSDKELYKHYMGKPEIYKWLESFFSLHCIRLMR
jgi:hypothetical protein